MLETAKCSRISQDKVLEFPYSCEARLSWLRKRAKAASECALCSLDPCTESRKKLHCRQPHRIFLWFVTVAKCKVHAACRSHNSRQKVSRRANLRVVELHKARVRVGLAMCPAAGIRTLRTPTRGLRDIWLIILPLSLPS